MRDRPAFLDWSPPPESPKEAWDIHRWQAGRCAACGDSGRPLVEDHDHRTGLIRGYLCRRCNNQEGQSRDHPYLKPWREGQNPCAHFGVTEEYAGWGEQGRQIFGATVA